VDGTFRDLSVRRRGKGELKKMEMMGTKTKYRTKTWLITK